MRAFSVALCVLMLGGAAHAQTSAPQGEYTERPAYDFRTMNFDLWCQETQRYPVDRCMERRADDVKAFEDYRAVIERYEMELLRQRQREAETQQRLNRDPIQAPGVQDPLAR